MICSSTRRTSTQGPSSPLPAHPTARVWRFSSSRSTSSTANSSSPAATHPPSRSRCPLRFSSRVAYTEFDGLENEYSISILDVATAQSTALASGEGVAGSPSWSPDGSTVAYNVQDVLATASSVFLLAAAEGEAGEGVLYYDPEWSPDGSTLLVAGQSETDTQLYEIDPENGNAEQFTTSNVYKRRPRYAPDGKTIAYTGSVIPETVSRNVAVLHQFGIFLLDGDGGNERALTADPRLNPGAGIDPDLDAFLMGWCLPGPWLDDSWTEVVETSAP